MSELGCQVEDEPVGPVSRSVASAQGKSCSHHIDGTAESLPPERTGVAKGGLLALGSGE
jgi:hypothetical protein